MVQPQEGNAEAPPARENKQTSSFYFRYTQAPVESDTSFHGYSPPYIRLRNFGWCKAPDVEVRPVPEHSNAVLVYT